MEAFLKHLSTTFADLSPAATAGATEAYRAAHAHVQRELSRLRGVLRADENATREIASISEQIAKTRASGSFRAILSLVVSLQVRAVLAVFWCMT